MGFRLSHSHSSSNDSPQQELKGVSRLVNPPDDAPEIVSKEEDQGERDYLGHLLHVADEVLRKDKKGILRRQRHRRGRIH